MHGGCLAVPTQWIQRHLAGVRTGDRASVVAWRSSAARRRQLLTERDVIALARRGERIPDGAILTPSAQDRLSRSGPEATSDALEGRSRGEIPFR